MSEVICEDGVCRLADAAGAATTEAVDAAVRLAHGYMDVGTFLNFLSGAEPASPTGFAAAVAAAFFGGIALNLTPCVLPMVPVNLMIIGNSVRRALMYSLGIATAYGALGVACATAGLVFGAIQSNPVFNLAVSLVFAAMACSLAGVFHLDFSRFRFRAGAFLMGMMSALLAGACVAPVMVSVLLLTSDLYAGGNVFSLLLPFAVGAGMALPWPFLAAGIRVLPKPGSWMRYVNIAFALVVAALAVRYALMAARGFGFMDGGGERGSGVWKKVESPGDFTLEGLKRPVIVDCWASWCSNCTEMDRTTLSDPKVKEALKEFSAVKLRAEDIGELRKLKGFEGVKGLPAFVIFE